MIIKICKICTKSFKTRPDRGIYCSVKCRVEDSKKQIQIICKICKKEFYSIPASHRQFCSIKCRQISLSYLYRFGNVWNWKGNKVNYFTLHTWIRKWLGTPKKCEHCGNNKLKPRQYHWANISKKYKRNFNDWVRLCAKCHKAFDKH